MGYTAAKDCVPANAPYNVEKDITFFEGLAEPYIAVKPGMFAKMCIRDRPHPATMFLLLTIAVVFLSWICDSYGLKVTLPQTGEEILVQSLLSRCV